MTYSILIYSIATEKELNKVTFETKRQANKFIKDNTEKRGYDFYSKTDRSIEFRKLY